MDTKICHCGCSKKTLAELMPGDTGVISRIAQELKALRKFQNVGFIEGSEVKVEAYAPFGGLMRVKVMNSSMVLHKDDAVSILIG